MIKDTLYAKYISQRSGHEILENEHGFVIYKINGEECFIVDMFVDINSRKKYYGSEFINELVEIAKSKKCKVITANVHLWDANYQVTLVSSFKNGFNIVRASNDILLISRNLED